MESCVLSGQEAGFSVRSTCARFPALEKSLNAIFTPAESAKCAISLRWTILSWSNDSANGGLALAGSPVDKTPEAGSTKKWAKAAIQKSISREHTFSVDTADAGALTHFWCGFPRWSRGGSAISRNRRERSRSSCATRISQRAPRPLQNAGSCDTQFRAGGCRSRALFARHGTGRRSGCSACMRKPPENGEGQTNLLDEEKTQRWRKTLQAVDRIRDKYGDGIVSLAAGMNADFSRARRSRSPENLPGQGPKKK